GVAEGLAVFGKLPNAREQRAAVPLADNLPGIGPLDGNGKSCPEAAGLVLPVGHDDFGNAAAKIDGVLICARDLNLHLISEFAFGRVELPSAYEGVVRCP